MSGYRFDDFADDELIVINCALSDDEGQWHDEGKEEIRKALMMETQKVIDARCLMPEDI